MVRVRSSQGSLNNLLHSNAILVSHSLISAAAAVGVVVDKQSSSSTKLALCVFLLLLGALGVMRFKNLLGVNRHPMLSVSFYFVIICAGLIFFAPIGSPYAYTWLLVLPVMRFSYGLKASLASLLVFATSLELQLLWHAYQSGQGITSSAVGLSLVQLAIVSAVSVIWLDTKNTTPKL